MNLGDLGKLLRTGSKTHMPVILSAAAGVGTLGTAYLAGKASWQAAEMVRLDEENNPPYRHKKNQIKGRVKLVWKLYIPTAFSAVGTVGLIVGANRIGAKKTLAAQTAFAVSQQVFSEYRDKVVEQYGERKEQSIRDQIAEDRVTKTAPSSEVVIAGRGEVLCLETFTGRYFNCDMETLRKSVNDINKQLLAHDYATLSDFYYLIGIAVTPYSSQLGWGSDRLMELEFSTQLTPDGRPCITLTYNYTKTL